MSQSDKLPYKVLRPLGISGRVEKGQVVYLTEQEAKAYDPADLIPYEDEAEVRTGEDERVLDELSLAELKEKAKTLGLKTSGSKSDLVERIQLKEEGSDTSDEDVEDTDEEVSDEDADKQ